ncbi:MAG TPA: hypothetical protein VGO98_01465 [Candidatus Saccharimonadales bacterium]|jgi:predicted RNA-binding Zn-ribbon protein involved in translation (DUF1610 family)|nr:hypothetical protein [Candidatus Saccharimonadales bacterium]
MTRLQKFIIGLTAFLLLGLIVWIFWFLSQTALSAQLNTLFNVLLTVFSVLLSLVMSHYYFDSSRQSTIEGIKSDYKKNNKLYSQKAAEKVDNLSNELTKLSIYLQQSIDDDNDLDPMVALLVREEKIRSAIHIVQTLKSINDKSLSDWLGVLDEEDIEEQNEIREEKREEREIEFRSILDNYRNFIAEDTGNPMRAQIQGENTQLKNVHIDLNELNKKIDKLATNIIGTPIKTNANLLAKEYVKGICPTCEEDVKYRQRPSEKSVKSFQCTSCGVRLMSKWSTHDGFVLTEKPARVASENTETPRKTVSDDVVTKVEKALPDQPWPKGTSSKIGVELGLSQNDMRRAIKELIRRGVYKEQIDNKLYDPVSEPLSTEVSTTHDAANTAIDVQKNT